MHIYAFFRGDSMPVQLLGNFFWPETVWVKTKGYSTIHRNSHLILIHTSLWYKYNYFATPNILITVVPPEHWPCRCVDHVDRADCADHAWPCMAMKTACVCMLVPQHFLYTHVREVGKWHFCWLKQTDSFAESCSRNNLDMASMCAWCWWVMLLLTEANWLVWWKLFWEQLGHGPYACMKLVSNIFIDWGKLTHLQWVVPGTTWMWPLRVHEVSKLVSDVFIDWGKLTHLQKVVPGTSRNK